MILISYNTLTSAEALAGQPLNQDILNVAKSVIDKWTEYRWTTTDRSLLGSGDGTVWVQLYEPLIAISSFTIDDVAQVDGTDYEIRLAEGKLYMYSPLPFGHDNIAISYTYGFTEDGAESEYYLDTFPSVRMSEAQIALYLRKNPMILGSVYIEGSSINFGNLSHTFSFERYLVNVPRPISFGAIGPSSENTIWGERI